MPARPTARRVSFGYRSDPLCIRAFVAERKLERILAEFGCHLEASDAAAPGSTERYLARVRTAFFVECRNVSERAVLLEIAEELVKAAERRPSRCVHPGAPLDLGEAGLDALIKRAAAFD